MIMSLNINNNGVENWLRSAAVLFDPYAAYSRALLYKYRRENRARDNYTGATEIYRKDIRCIRNL